MSVNYDLQLMAYFFALQMHQPKERKRCDSFFLQGFASPLDSAKDMFKTVIRGKRCQWMTH